MTDVKAPGPQDPGDDVLVELDALDARSKLLKSTAIGIGIAGGGALLASAALLFFASTTDGFSDLHVPQSVLDGLPATVPSMHGGLPVSGIGGAIHGLLTGTVAKIVALLALAAGFAQAVLRGNVVGAVHGVTFAMAVYLGPQLLTGVGGALDEGLSVRATVTSLLSEKKWRSAVATMGPTDPSVRQYLDSQVSYLQLQESVAGAGKGEEGKVSEARKKFASTDAVARLPETAWETLSWKPELGRIHAMESEAFGKATSPAAKKYLEEAHANHVRNQKMGRLSLALGVLLGLAAAGTAFLALSIRQRAARVRNMILPAALRSASRQATHNKAKAGAVHVKEGASSTSPTPSTQVRAIADDRDEWPRGAFFPTSTSFAHQAVEVSAPHCEGTKVERVDAPDDASRNSSACEDVTTD